MKVKEQDLLRLLANAADRTARKLTAQRKELEKQVIAQQDEVDEMRYDLDRPIDDDYIIKFAREKLGLRLPGETIFHYDARK